MSSESISMNSSNDKNGMDIEARQHNEALKEERRIQRLMGYDLGSASSSSRSLGSDVSASSSGKRAAAMGDQAGALRAQEKLVAAFQHHADKTAVRAVLYLKMITDPTTLIIKSVCQEKIHTGQDPMALLASIDAKSLRYPADYYVHFTERDQQGYYVIGWVYYFLTYRSILGQFEADFVKNMVLEILNSMGNTALFKQYHAFIANGAETLSDYGMDVADINQHLTKKFTQEFMALADLIGAMPVKFVAAGQHYAYSFTDSIKLIQSNLGAVHPTYVHGVSAYFANVEAQIRGCCMPQTGGRKAATKAHRVNMKQFHFSRFSKVGPRKRFF